MPYQTIKVAFNMKQHHSHSPSSISLRLMVEIKDVTLVYQLNRSLIEHVQYFTV